MKCNHTEQVEGFVIPCISRAVNAVGRVGEDEPFAQVCDVHTGWAQSSTKDPTWVEALEDRRAARR